ncbi:MAG: thioredoxin family protein [Williamsia sp.]|nr:thioredoxin family protein [Williamsia sp.]
MKSFLLAVLLAVSVLYVRAQEILQIGAPLPKGDIKMKDVSGNLVSLNDIKTGNGLLVMFSCNTCPYVRANQGRTREICQYAMEKSIGVILLNSNEGTRGDGDSYADMQAYAKEQGYKWSYAVDSHNELADAFGANRTPECFLFDATGKLLYHGAIDNGPADPATVTRAHLKEALNEMLAGKPVSVKESRSVGCNIKRKG